SRAIEARQRVCRGCIGHVRDEWIERRTALGLVEPCDRRPIGGVGTEPVDGLGRKRDQTAFGEYARGPFDRVASGLEQLRHRLRGHAVARAIACACSPAGTWI